MAGTSSIGIGTSPTRDYSTIQLWEDATDGTVSGIEIGECYDDSGTDFAETVTFAGATTDASNYRILRAAAGEEHDGITGSTSGTGVKVIGTNNNHIIEIYEAYLDIGAGMVFQLQTGSGNSSECMRVGDGSNTCEGLWIHHGLFDNLLQASDQDGIYSGNYDVGTASNPITVQECFIRSAQRSGVHMQAWGNADTHYWRIINCTVIACQEAGLGYDLRKAGSSITVVLINNVVGQSSASFGDFHPTNSGFAEPGTLTLTGSTNNFTEDGTIEAKLTGAEHDDNPAILKAAEGGDTWEAIVTVVWSDPHWQDIAGNDVLGKGVGNGDNSLVSTTDYEGNDRGTGSTCDPGCHQISAVGGGPAYNEFARPHVNTLLRM